MGQEVYDRVFEGYEGGMGAIIQKATKERIVWICEQVMGNRVLDVGCSQGICSILLGREGVSVDGIDISERAITYARERLSEESESTQKRVFFQCGDFMSAEYPDAYYSTVIMGEVLEHLVTPASFVKKAYNLLKEDGRLIVTVPYGINPYFDHKRTYYFMEVFRTLSTDFSVTTVKFFGRWIGFVAERSIAANTVIELNEALISEMERAFFTAESYWYGQTVTLTNDKTTLTNKLNETRDALNRANELCNKYKDALQAANEKNMQYIEKLHEATALKDDAKRNAAEADAAYQKAVAERNAAQRRLIELQTSESSLRTQLEQKKLECKAALTELDSLKQTFACMQDELGGLLIDFSNQGKNAVELLADLKANLNKLQAQNRSLRTQNEEQSQKLSKVYNTWYGRIALRAYKVLKKTKSAITRH